MLAMHGDQMIAAKDIAFTANANGTHGAGMENNFEAACFRLARLPIDGRPVPLGQSLGRVASKRPSMVWLRVGSMVWVMGSVL